MPRTTTNPYEAARFASRDAARAFGDPVENGVPHSGLPLWVALGDDGDWLTPEGCGFLIGARVASRPDGPLSFSFVHPGGVRLVDLEPRWTSDNDEHHGQGISFRCPLCRRGHYSVAFRNPIDGLGPTLADHTILWERDGSTFDTLTLAPSLNAERCCSSEGCPGWHGYISGGACVGGGV